MECQEKIHVPVFTDINKDIFLQDIYPQVRRIFAALNFLWRNMCSQSPYSSASSFSCFILCVVSVVRLCSVMYYICKIQLFLWCKTQHYSEVRKDIPGWEWHHCRLLFAPSANQPCWEGLIWGHVWKSGQLNISDRKDQIRRWRSTYPLSRRWTFFAKTSCTSELSHTNAPRNADKPPQLHWFIHRTLPFSEFVKRASERKHSDFFLCEVTNVLFVAQ